MGLYRPKEVLVGGADGCGLEVSVALAGKRVHVMETELDTSVLGQAWSEDGEGVHVVTGEQSVYIRTTAIVSKLACRKCGVCVAETDYSIAVEPPKFIPEGDERIAGLEATYAAAVIEMSGVREIAQKCVAERTA